MSIIGVGLGGAREIKGMGDSLSLRGKWDWVGMGRTNLYYDYRYEHKVRLDQAALLRATLVYYTCTMIDALVYILDDQERANIYSSLGSEVCTNGPVSPSLCTSIMLDRPGPLASQNHHLPADQPSRLASAYLQFLFMSRQSTPFPGFSSSANSNRVAVSSPRTIISTPFATPSTTYAHPTTTPSHPTPPTPPTPPSQTNTSPPPSQTPYADSSAPAAPPR